MAGEEGLIGKPDLRSCTILPLQTPLALSVSGCAFLWRRSAFCVGALLMHGMAHLRDDAVWSAIEIALAAAGILMAVQK
jgi:hypothetical protein